VDITLLEIAKISDCAVHHKPLLFVAATSKWMRILFVDCAHRSISKMGNEWSFGI